MATLKAKKNEGAKMADGVKTEELIFTIGYEKSTIDEFVDRLADAEIEVLVDVRELPLSRKKGFSKNGLNCPASGPMRQIEGII